MNNTNIALPSHSQNMNDVYQELNTSMLQNDEETAVAYSRYVQNKEKIVIEQAARIVALEGQLIQNKAQCETQITQNTRQFEAQIAILRATHDQQMQAIARALGPVNEEYKNIYPADSLEYQEAAKFPNCKKNILSLCNQKI